MKNITTKYAFSILFITAVITLGCTSPLDRPYQKSSLEEDIEAIKESNEIDSADMLLLGLYLVKGQLTGEEFNDQTYSEILANAKVLQKMEQEREAEQERLAEKVRKEELDREEKLRQALNVALYSKDFQKVDWQDYITYQFAFENNSGKDIRAFKGVVVFTDLFDEEINSLSLTYDKIIPAGGRVTWSAQTDYNQFIEKDIKLRNKDLKDLKVKWKPEKIIFTDNSSL